jgi:hypothetical protein
MEDTKKDSTRRCSGARTDCHRLSCQLQCSAWRRSIGCQADPSLHPRSWHIQGDRVKTNPIGCRKKNRRAGDFTHRGKPPGERIAGGESGDGEAWDLEIGGTSSHCWSTEEICSDTLCYDDNACQVGVKRGCIANWLTSKKPRSKPLRMACRIRTSQCTAKKPEEISVIIRYWQRHAWTQ